MNLAESQDDKNCPLCGSKMIDKEFNGDWKVLECSDDTCDAEINSPVGNPEEDGFTMESLKLASEYADQQ